MASAPPRPGPARNSQADGSAVDLDGRAGGPAFDDPSGNRAIAFSYRISASPTSASATGGSSRAGGCVASGRSREDRSPCGRSAVRARWIAASPRGWGLDGPPDSALGRKRATDGNHRFCAFVDGPDDLRAIDSAQISRRDREIGVP